jgi:Fe-S-cluster containining protein
MSSQTPTDWFQPRGGLRFQCTCCGNCCTGPEGYILFTEAEGAAIAARLGLSREQFLANYTKQTTLGVSLKEKETPHGLDCVFLDRQTSPGKAICGIYEDRPAQCRTWPFWKSIVRTEASWQASSHNCPGINRGKLISPDQIRILRDSMDM